MWLPMQRCATMMLSAQQWKKLVLDWECGGRQLQERDEIRLRHSQVERLLLLLRHFQDHHHRLVLLEVVFWILTM